MVSSLSTRSSTFAFHGHLWLFLVATTPQLVAGNMVTLLPTAMVTLLPTAPMRVPPIRDQRRTSKLMAQDGWTTAIDEVSGETYYYNADSGMTQWAPPQAAAAQQNYGNYDATQVLWRVAGFCGVAGFNFFQENEVVAYGKAGSSLVYIPLPYTLRNGDEQVLSRWNMLKQKLTVSRKQSTVRILNDGTATLTSIGRGPTLWRARGDAWYELRNGESLVLSDQDQVSLDCNDPEAAIFTCHDERAVQQDGYAQGGYAQDGYAQDGYAQDGYAPNGYAQGRQAQLPHPWEQVVDQDGVYYRNPQTGVTTWDPPQPGG